MELSNLYKKHNFLNKNIKYIKNNVITEYDMKEAGFNLLKRINTFNNEELVYLESLTKEKRTIAIGKYLKNHPNVNKILMEEFVKARKVFFELNNISDNEVLSIKKDAIFLINKKCAYTKIDNYIEFRPKHNYTTFINISNNEFYFNSYTKELDVKGLPEESKKHHQDYLFKELKKFLLLDSKGERKLLIEELLYFKNDFVCNNLEDGYYFDIYKGSYLINLFSSYIIGIDVSTPELRELFVVKNNLNFIIELISILI